MVREYGARQFPPELAGSCTACPLLVETAGLGTHADNFFCDVYFDVVFGFFFGVNSALTACSIVPVYERSLLSSPRR